MKFSPPGKDIQVFVKRTVGGGLALGVEDHGHGMSADGLKKALEPFGQAKAMETVEGRELVSA